jgi:two-component sensor histidine kinase
MLDEMAEAVNSGARPWPRNADEMGRRIRERDWPATGLGAPQGWPPRLRHAVEFALATPMPAAVAWGRELILIYGAGFVPFLGTRHPGALGLPAREVWGEIAGEIDAARDAVFTGGRDVTQFGTGLDAADLSHGLTWTPITDDFGAVAGCVLVAMPADVLSLPAQMIQPPPSQELQHRVRNMLAMFRSIVRRGAPVTGNAEDYALHLEDRIDVLARTQAAIVRTPAASADVEEAVRDELLAQAVDEARIAIEGPPVALPARTAEIFALAVHELATNAIKYGALGAQRATLSVAWRREERGGSPWFVFEWREAGLRPGPAQRFGFGSELITQRIPYELRGTGVLEIRADGAYCMIALPMPD